jgi:hypothetical protein
MGSARPERVRSPLQRLDQASGPCSPARMRPCTAALVLTLLAATAACAGARQPPAGGTCRESQQLCLTGRDCTTDRSGCEVCVCRSADRTLEPLPGPAGARPEDRREPQLPPLR